MLKDSVSVIYPSTANGFWGEDGDGHANPDGPIPDTIQVTNAPTELGAVNDVRENCPQPILADAPEMFTLTGINVNPGHIDLLGHRHIPAMTVGSGYSVCGQGTTGVSRSDGSYKVNLFLTTAEWESVLLTTQTFTSPNIGLPGYWTVTIGPN